MADTPSSILLLRLQATGSNTNLWGGYLNTAMSTIEQASKGYQALAVTGDATITWTNYSTGNTGQCAVLKLTGTLAATATLTAPAYNNIALVWNTTGQTVTIKCAAGTGVAIPNNRKALIFCDGTDYYSAVSTWTGDSTTLANNGDIPSYTQVAALIAAAIAAASISVSGQVLNTVSDTTPGYLGSKQTVTTADDLFLATKATANAGANENTQWTFSARRVLRRASFLGQV